MNGIFLRRLEERGFWTKVLPRICNPPEIRKGGHTSVPSRHLVLAQERPAEARTDPPPPEKGELLHTGSTRGDQTRATDTPPENVHRRTNLPPR